MGRPLRSEAESMTKKKHGLGIKIGRPRARSAPPPVKNSLIENYYNVDTDRNVVLPGVPSYDQDWHRDIHDFFNLMILVRSFGRGSSVHIHRMPVSSFLALT